MPTKIEWAQMTWNPIVGCDKVSAGCKNCYAINMANRLQGMPGSKDKYAGTVSKTPSGSLNWTGKVNYSDEWLVLPLNTKKPTRFFVNSMSDLFHKDIPFDFIDRVFSVMALCPQHTFQILTKRPERMAEYFKRDIRNAIFFYAERSLNSPSKEIVSAAMNIYVDVLRKDAAIVPLPNVWLGVSVEDQKSADERIPYLLSIPAAVRWLSMEPLIGPVNFRWVDWAHQATGETYREYLGRNGGINQYEALLKIDWIVVGGESGPNARPMHPDWVNSIRNACKEAKVPFFFKQWGAYAPGSHLTNKNFTVLNNGDYNIDTKELINKYHSKWNDMRPTVMYKSSKKDTGRELDGLEYNEYPV